MAAIAETMTGVSKSEAARKHGLGHSALTPAQLAEAAAKNPALRELRKATDLWSITVEVAGRVGRVSAKEAISKMVESAVCEVAHLGCKLAALSREERTRLSFAAKTLSWAKSLGLWSDTDGVAPGELAATLRANEEQQQTVDWLLADHTRRDGIGPTLRRMRETVLTVDTPAEPVSPVESPPLPGKV